MIREREYVHQFSVLIRYNRGRKSVESKEERKIKMKLANERNATIYDTE